MHTQSTSSEGSGDESKYQLIKMLQQMCLKTNCNSNSTTSSDGASAGRSDNESPHELADSNTNTSDESVGQSTHDDDNGHANKNSNNNRTAQTPHGSSNKRKNVIYFKFNINTN